MSFLIIGGLGTPPVPVSARVAVEANPPFVAEGSITSRGFKPGQINPYLTSEATFFFSYSNKWWHVELRYVNPEQGSPAVENCMAVPGGIRSYTLFEGDTWTGLKAADVCPVAYPPPGRAMLFVTWLGLCQNPELPLIDKSTMRRFINIPFCAPELFNHSQNEGYYGLRYLEPGHGFLSELCITNNGVSIDVGNENEPEIFPLPSPFDKGFLELRHKTLQTTNVAGVKFPLQVECRYLGPNWNKKDPNDLHTWQLIELTVERITFGEEWLQRQSSPPSRLFALDFRPPDLPKHRTVNYVVTNDQWKSASDPQIVHLAAMARGENTSQDKPSHGWALITLALVILTGLVPFILYRNTKRLK